MNSDPSGPTSIPYKHYGRVASKIMYILSRMLDINLYALSPAYPSLTELLTQIIIWYTRYRGLNIYCILEEVKTMYFTNTEKHVLKIHGIRIVSRCSNIGSNILSGIVIKNRDYKVRPLAMLLIVDQINDKTRENIHKDSCSTELFLIKGSKNDRKVVMGINIHNRVLVKHMPGPFFLRNGAYTWFKKPVIRGCKAYMLTSIFDYSYLDLLYTMIIRKDPIKVRS